MTDNFRPSVIGLCETKIDSNIEQLYNLAGYTLTPNNNQLNKVGLALYIKNNIPGTIKPSKYLFAKVLNQFLLNLLQLMVSLWLV